MDISDRRSRIINYSVFEYEVGFDTSYFDKFHLLIIFCSIVFVATALSSGPERHRNPFPAASVSASASASVSFSKQERHRNHFPAASVSASLSSTMFTQCV